MAMSVIMKRRFRKDAMALRMLKALLKRAIRAEMAMRLGGGMALVFLDKATAEAEVQAV
jgi:hypothetical protein